MPARSWIRWWWTPFVCATLLFVGCEDAADDDDDDTVGWDEVTVDDVTAVIEGGCTAEGLDSLSGAEPAAVREALAAADQAFKLSEWIDGTTHGNPVGDLGLRTELLAATAFDYSLYVPPEYTADPADPLPLYLDPGHPVDDLDSALLEYKADLLDEPVFFVQDNLFNRLYTDLGDDEYTAQVLNNPDFDAIAAYQDHEQIIGEIFRQMRQRYHVDPGRIYVGGVSAEGNASWCHGMLSSDQYAAIMPVSAGVAAYHEDLWLSLENVGVLVVHGTEDELCPVEDADDAVDMLEGWGFDVEYWRYEGEGHGTMFWDDFTDMVDWLVQRERPVTPAHVHHGFKSDRDADIYWIAVHDVTSTPTASFHNSDPVAVVDATWEGSAVVVEASGVGALELRWLDGPAGPAAGTAGDTVQVTVNGTDLGAHELVEDPTVAVEDYCRHADVTRLWAGRVTVDVP